MGCFSNGTTLQRSPLQTWPHNVSITSLNRFLVCFYVTSASNLSCCKLIAAVRLQKLSNVFAWIFKLIRLRAASFVEVRSAMLNDEIISGKSSHRTIL